MLTANQARQLRETMQKQSIAVELHKILSEIAERALDPNGKDYIYVDLDYVDERADYVINNLKYLGYIVEESRYPEDSCCSLTVRF